MQLTLSAQITLGLFDLAAWQGSCLHTGNLFLN